MIYLYYYTTKFKTMKKVLFTMFCGILLSGCISDDFNTDKLVDDIAVEPGLAIPLIQASVSMRDVFSEDTDYVRYYTDEDGNERIMLYQDRDSVSFIDLDDIYKVTIQSAAAPIPFVLLNDGKEHTINVTIPLDIANGTISAMQLDYDLHIKGADFPSALYVKVHLPTVNAKRGGKTVIVDVDNGDPVVQFHKLDFIELVNGGIPAEITIKALDTSSKFGLLDIGTLTVWMENYNFNYIKGTLEEAITQFAEGIVDFDFDVLNKIPDGIEFINPQLKLLLTNSTPFEGIVEPVFTAQGGSTPGLQLNFLNDISISPAPKDVIAVSDTITLLNNNSNIGSFFSATPDSIAYKVGLRLNPGFALTEEVELDNSSSVYFGYMIEIPVEVLLNASIVVDTINVSDIDFIKDFLEAKLDVKGISRFPFEAEVFIDIFEEEKQGVTETINAIILDPANVDSEGIVTNVVERNTEVKLTGNQIDQLSKSDKLIVRFRLRSANYESKQPVVLLTNNSLSVELAIKGRLRN